MYDGKDLFESKLPEWVVLVGNNLTDEALGLLNDLETLATDVSPDTRDWFERTIWAYRADTYASAHQNDRALEIYAQAQSEVHDSYPLNQHSIANILESEGRHADSMAALSEGLRVADILKSSYAVELIFAYEDRRRDGELPPSTEFAALFVELSSKRGLLKGIPEVPQTQGSFLNLVHEVRKIQQKIQVEKGGKSSGLITDS